MDESVKTPPPETAEPIASPPPAVMSSAQEVPPEVPPTDGTVSVASDTSIVSATPSSTNPARQNIAKKPIFAVVFSMVLFSTLCAVAFYAYSQSN